MSSGGRQYRLIRELGTGTFGTVYQAEMMSVGGFSKQVALKVLHPMWEKHPDAARRFRDEARLLGRLRHRHVVQVDGLVRVGGRWAVVMEYIEGIDGNVLIKACRKAKKPFPIAACLEIAAAIAMALDAAYNHAPEGQGPLRVIHRDIKPSNVRVTLDADVKVLDFGIAQADFSGREAATQSIRYGSIRYMAPERRNAEDDTPAGDIYALGCVLYEMLMGRPFGNAMLDGKEHDDKVKNAIALVRKRGGGQADMIAMLLEAMLEFDPKKRLGAGEVSDEARALSRSAPGMDLHGFARNFLPTVPQYVSDTSEAVARTVGTEYGDEDSDMFAEPGSIPVVFTEEVGHSKQESEEPTESSTGSFEPPPSRRRPPVWVPIATAAAIALVATIAQALVPAHAGMAGDAADRLSAIATETSRPALSIETNRVVTPDVEPPPVDEAAKPAPKPAPPTTAPQRTAPARRTTPDTTSPPAPAAPAPVASQPDEPAVTTPEPPAPAAPIRGAIRGAKFTHNGAESIVVSCVGGSAAGTTFALARGISAGPCTVDVVVEGKTHRTEVSVTRAGGFTCAIDNDALVCR